MDKEKARSEISIEYKWDVESVIKDFDLEIKNIKLLLKKVESYKNSIMNNSMTLLNFLKDYEILDQTFETLYVCANMICDTDTTNYKYQENKLKVEKLSEEISTNLSFITPEIIKASYSKIKKYMTENSELKHYAFYFKNIFRYKNHTLSKKEEEIIAKAQNAMGVGDDVFYNIDNSDINLGSITLENNETIKITNSNFNKYMKSEDRNIRIQAFDAMYGYFRQFKNTIASCLKGNIKENFFISDIKKFNSPLEQSLYSDNIKLDVYKNLINTTNNNLNKLHDYMYFRKKALKLDEMHMYDLYVDLVKNNDENITFDEAKNMILDALKPLGEDYINDLKKAFTDKWIDIYPNKGKKSGAYSWGTYNTKPYLLLNYNSTIDSVSTMIHELGHSMHSYYSKIQGFTYHQYPIFLAEIASTVNEILLNDYLYKHAKDKKTKILYLTEMLDKIRTTIYRQTQFAEFEMIIHDKEKNNVPLTSEEFSNTYYELNKKYYGNNIISDENIRYEWARIPHFYNSFYVYKYATGLTSALAISTEILNGNVKVRDNYLNFLRSGGSDYPLNILKKVGIDISKEKTIQKAFDFFEEKLTTLKNIYNK